MSRERNSIAKSWLSRRRFGAAILPLAALLLLPAAAQSASHGLQRQLAAHHDMSQPHVYLMRGLLNIFSLGMDQLAAQVQRYGIDAQVYNHTYADSIVGQIAQMYRAGDQGPYMLVGHSLGADAVMAMAQQLNVQGVPVALVVPVDGTGSYAAPGNVACLINITQRKYAYMQRGAGFRGLLTNIDLSDDPSIDHLTIDKAPRVQAEALRYIVETAHAETCRPGIAGPVATRPKGTPAPKLAAPKSAAPTKTASPVLRPTSAG
jgi:pimeloyl-ACP methyl ester carboxylesterase